MDRQWALGQNGRSFPRWSSLLSTRPALLPWLRLVWKDRSKDDLTKPRFCPEKQRPGHHARPRECGLVSLAVSGPNRELRGGKANASTAGADQKSGSRRSCKPTRRNTVLWVSTPTVECL